ncbi:MAG: tol-pal system protein YbgF [Alphaproteobacteria bacterium]|nr:tol-pal system protein YbgF [Alphaproteobacteria bacterium]
MLSMLRKRASIQGPSRSLPGRARAAGFAVVLAGILTAGLGPSLVSAPALAQSSGDIQGLVDRIDRLQRELTTLQRQVYRGATPQAATGGGGVTASPNLVADMQVRMDEIETRLRRFTGRMEELQHAIDTMRKSMDKLASDIDFRLKTLEGRAQAPAGPAGATSATAAVAPGAAGTPGPGLAVVAPTRGAPGQAPIKQVTPRGSAAPAPLTPQVLGTIPRAALQRQQSAAPEPSPASRAAAAQPRRPQPTAEPQPGSRATAARAVVGATPEAQYKHATDLLFRSDYAGAERAFAAFVEAHPKHRLAGNAQYWLGETHYARGAYRSAAAVFAEGYQKYPTSAKGADNLLKLGMSLVALDKKKSACTTFSRLLKEYPKASSSLRSSARSQRKSLRCRR